MLAFMFVFVFVYTLAFVSVCCVFVCLRVDPISLLDCYFSLFDLMSRLLCIALRSF